MLKKPEKLTVLFSGLSLFLLFSTAVCRSQDRGAARDAWQHPEFVMNTLGLKPGSVVADVGAGEGYFTFHLAKRVGPMGKVFAEDINDDVLSSIRNRASRENLPQIETIHGKPDNPELPAESLDAVLIVNAYHEFRDYNDMLHGLWMALRPSGLLAVIDSPTEPATSRDVYLRIHHIPESTVRDDVEHAGFHFLRREPGFTRPSPDKEFFFLIFEKP